VEAGSELSENKEHAMATIRLHQNTTVTPEQFLAGLTDVGPCHTYTLTPKPDGTTPLPAARGDSPPDHVPTLTVSSGT
jgi:hypothetical protein